MAEPRKTSSEAATRRGSRPPLPEPAAVFAPGAEAAVAPEADDAEAARSEREAANLESRLSLGLAISLGLLVAPMLVLVSLRYRELLPGALPDDHDGIVTRSVATVLLLLVASQLVAVLLAWEHAVAGPLPIKADKFAMVKVWVGRGLLLAAVAAALVVPWRDPNGWLTVLAVGTALEVAVLMLAQLSLNELAKATGPEDSGPAQHDLRAQTSETQPPATQPAGWTGDGHRLLAIGASGGGIRAASFVLGGHQAVQEGARQPGTSGRSLDRSEPAVFAVSGGSYIAAALALRRTYDAHGLVREKPDDWLSSYQPGSPELERLRRHTRYLFEPTWRTRDGIATLLIGAILNLLIVGLALRFVVWLSTVISLTMGTLDLTRVGGETIGVELFVPDWNGWSWVALLGIPVLCLLALLALTLDGWSSTDELDDVPDPDVELPESSPQRTAVAKLERSARWRPTLAIVAVTWLLLTLGVPAATVGVVSMATANHPTTTGASVLTSLGLASEDLCEHAAVASITEAYTKVDDEAALSPSVDHDATAGACGFETTVLRKADAEADSPTQDGTETAVHDLLRGSLPGTVGGIVALLTLVIGMLHRGPAPEVGASATWWSRLKRVLLTWLPLGIVGAVAAYLCLRWAVGFATTFGQQSVALSALLTVGACVLAFTVNANATSMHGFYRSRLSDAFAVSVDDHGRADELPGERVYRFSDLAWRDPDAAPKLHIVATLNSQAPNETPTMRGGFPFVLGASRVQVPREAGQRIDVPTKRYEAFAGPGRVSVMASVAISGAAISPLMGRYAVQMAPYRLLLALFNLRLGTWVRNPLHTHDNSGERAYQLPWLWMTRKPGLAQVALEAAGRSSADRRWVYLSDGGHLDNTGLVEAVRHCCAQGERGRILVLDASNDPVGAWSAVGDAIGVIRADLDVDLRRREVPDEAPWMRVYGNDELEVMIVKAVRVAEQQPDDPEPDDAEPDPDWWGVLPPNVQSFQLVHSDFPRSSTGRQKFGDLEFEAYRAFGFATTLRAMRVAGWINGASPATP